jgi:hypothetical protein
VRLRAAAWGKPAHVPRFARDSNRRQAPPGPFDVFRAVDEQAPLDAFPTRVLWAALDTARDTGLTQAAAQVAFELGVRVGRAGQRA